MPRNRGCSQSHLQLSLLYYHHKQLQFNELTNSTHADLRMAHVTGPTVIATQLDPRPFAPHPIAVPGERCSPGSLCNWIPGPGITPKIAILGCLETLGSDCNWIPDYKGQSSTLKARIIYLFIYHIYGTFRYGRNCVLVPMTEHRCPAQRSK